MDQRIINLFDEYTHKPLKRDDFLKRLAKLTGSMAAAMTVLPLLEVNYAQAATVAHTDDRIKTESITYPGADTTMKGYLARPAAPGKYPAVVVIHENRGLNPHIEDVTRRMALAGFVALAPDALSAAGGTPTDETQMRELFGKLDATATRNNFVKAVEYLKTQANSTGKVGCVGFCWGGAMANQLAIHAPDLKAAVPFYGRQPDAADVPKMKAAVQLHYGGLDERVNAGIPAYEAALKAAGIPYELYIYEGAQHAFNNDTAPTRYNEAAAKLAWERTTKFLKEKLV
ncbi:dienelactone hydrolase family protein [Fibrivirga algicola]|uniref:Dienelactone hydrolase family protein n=1 Tax=Fibrivirga algicola TaxID=2950420 RepID=A0ABX0QJ93_9BACT|nr:dienelactone hydrolase family protein [Fibrivirga algicola]ARK12519.1 carboxymethylenebutenolidase [Fibrella sp. ES10-3-2-2]NID12334.1 dienelactone hydrolase family protein [Fibrivirga algicola]